ncbi:unnamed protein product [Protopolystoma xenopodis]|uniref:Uncharacterized protein n=1 Tax=Protopolystoma xenopodis TaxID=117903 RepID=A0A448X5X0_9PLAT|nr:unnamed protein product [Protopolystoma xenopodis]
MTFFEKLQDKLSQLREAREALDSLRADAAERRRQEEAEAARLRQLQLIQRLEVMRQQKREFLEYKRLMVYEQTMQYQQQYQAQPSAGYQPNEYSAGCQDPQIGQLPLTHHAAPLSDYPNLPGLATAGPVMAYQIPFQEANAHSVVKAAAATTNYAECHPIGYPSPAYQTIPGVQDSYNLRRKSLPLLSLQLLFL